MSDDKPPETAQPADVQVKVPIARVFMMDGQWFDFPLFQGWPAFMTNLLNHRGFLATNAWLPERMIRAIFVDPQAGGVDPSKIDTKNVVVLRPQQGPGQPAG